MKLRVRSLTLARLGALIALQISCAHTPARVEDQAQAKTVSAQRTVVTGSHIPQRVDPSTGLPATVSPAWIYSRNQLTDTGRQADLGAALRSLDPSITP